MELAGFSDGRISARRAQLLEMRLVSIERFGTRLPARAVGCNRQKAAKSSLSRTAVTDPIHPLAKKKSANSAG